MITFCRSEIPGAAQPGGFVVLAQGLLYGCIQIGCSRTSRETRTASGWQAAPSLVSVVFPVVSPHGLLWTSCSMQPRTSQLATLGSLTRVSQERGAEAACGLFNLALEATAWPSSAFSWEVVTNAHIQKEGVQTLPLNREQ